MLTDKNFAEAVERELDHYTPAPKAIALIQQTPILLLGGVIGAGKEAVAQALLGTKKYYRIISHTTRQTRVNNGVLEQDGVEYHFVDFAQAGVMIKRNEFVQAKIEHGNIYGTSVAEITAANQKTKIALVDIDVTGVAAYKTFNRSATAIFVLPPSFDGWLKSLESPKNVDVPAEASSKQQVLRVGAAELEKALATDYFVFIVNTEIDATVKMVKKLIKRSGKAVDDAEAKAYAREFLHRMNGAVDTQNRSN